jgi:hypothetical protein
MFVPFVGLIGWMRRPDSIHVKIANPGGRNMDLKALRILAAKNGFGEDGQTKNTIIFSTKEHAKPHSVEDRGDPSGIDIDAAESLKVKILRQFPDLEVHISTMGPWVMLDVSDPEEAPDVEGRI